MPRKTRRQLVGKQEDIDARNAKTPCAPSRASYTSLTCKIRMIRFRGLLNLRKPLHGFFKL
jgi:hypothetical protein